MNVTLRFWYETSDPNIRFTEEQLSEIRKVQLSAVLCRNCDKPGKLPKHGFDVMDQFTNPMTNCDKMDHLDLSKWKEL